MYVELHTLPRQQGALQPQTICSFEPTFLPNFILNQLSCQEIASNAGAERVGFLRRELESLFDQLNVIPIMSVIHRWSDR